MSTLLPGAVSSLRGDLRAFVATYAWTVEASQRAVASNYPGAYLLPSNIYAVVAPQMNVPAQELVPYQAQIKSMICGSGVA